MILDLLGLKPRTPGPTVTVEIRRRLRLTVDGANRHVEPGEILTVPESDISVLEPGDYRLISRSTREEIEAVPDPCPPREDPRPLPDRWAELPECFSDYWHASEQFRVAREHLATVRKIRVEVLGAAGGMTDNAKAAIVGSLTVSDDQRDKSVYSTLRAINPNNPIVRRQAEFIDKAEAAAEDHLRRLTETKLATLQRSFIECGRCRLAAAGEVNALIEQIESVGFQIFRERIAALGLSEHKARQLFAGSADAQRFAGIALAYVGSTVSAGFDAEGVQVVYSDRHPASQATWMLETLDRRPALVKLLAEAKAELARTRKASKGAV